MRYRKLLFITGTRADFGKMKGLIGALDQDEEYEVYVYVSGMHLLTEFGNTYKDVLEEKYKNVFVDYTQLNTNVASIDCGNIITNLSSYVKKIKPEIIFVHGDRVEAIAGALVGLMNNIYVGHIEGGEVTGTIDDSIRHAVSKMAHFHFVTTKIAKNRLIQMGESEDRIFIIGSPDIDIMLSLVERNIDGIKKCNLKLNNKYAILIYHPVATEVKQLATNIEAVVRALKQRDYDYIVMYPNNDLGYKIIMEEYKKLEYDKRFHFFKSLPFEVFLGLLKNAEYIIGNSSAGIVEAGVYGIPAIDIGTRQNARVNGTKTCNLQHVGENVEEICSAIDSIEKYRIKNLSFGCGNSVELFMNIIKSDMLDSIVLQKIFKDIYIDE